jgi:capsular exopolysaccharide synthesis family protein
MALIVVIGVGLLLPPVYQAHTTVRVLIDVGVSDFIMREDYAKRLLSTYAEVLESDPFLVKAIVRLPQRVSLASLDDAISVEIVPNTELLDIAAEHRDPAVARDLANAMPIVLSDYAQELYVGSSKSTGQILEEQLTGLSTTLERDRQRLAELMASEGDVAEIETLNSEIEFNEDAYDRLLDRYELARLNEALRANSITVVAPATLPKTPVNRVGLTQVALGLALGLMGGVGLALVLENLDTRIHSSQPLEDLGGLPVLARLPKGFLSAADLDSEDVPETSRRLIESYRLLCIRLLGLRQQIKEKGQGPIQTILVTSAVSHEGKSMVTINLARAFAEQGQSVVLVDGNLRHPAITKRIGLEDKPGLGNLAVDRTPLDDNTLAQLIHPMEQPGLFVVGSGQEVPNPTAVLASPSMEKLLQYLGAQGQATLLDAPPVLGVAGVSALAPRVDGVILVVKQSYSKREDVTWALRQLQAMEARVLGVVFVQARSNEWATRSLSLLQGRVRDSGDLDWTS